MRACPYCAESIQDAAVLCKHCGRDISPVASAPSTAQNGTQEKAAQQRKQVSPARIVVLLLILVGAGIFLFRVLRTGGGDDAGSVAASVAAAAGALPDVVTAINDDSLVIGPGQFREWTWSVESPRLTCHLLGTLDVTGGGAKDIQVFVASEAAASALAKGDTARAYFSSGKESHLDLDVTTQGSGRFSLLASNAFSLLTSKTVTIKNASIRCSV